MQAFVLQTPKCQTCGRIFHLSLYFFPHHHDCHDNLDETFQFRSAVGKLFCNRAKINSLPVFCFCSVSGECPSDDSKSAINQKAAFLVN